MLKRDNWTVNEICNIIEKYKLSCDGLDSEQSARIGLHNCNIDLMVSKLLSVNKIIWTNAEIKEFFEPHISECESIVFVIDGIFQDFCNEDGTYTSVYDTEKNIVSFVRLI